MKSTRLGILLLALIMLATCFAGCGGTAEPQTTTAGSTAATTAAAPETTAATSATTAATTTAATTEATTADPWDLSTSSSWDDAKWLEYEKTQLDFGGYTFYMATSDKANRRPDEGVESEFNTAWWDKWDELETDLNIKVEFTDEPSLELLTSLFVSGDCYSDSCELKTNRWFSVYNMGGLVNLSSDETKATGFDVDNPKFVYQAFTHAWDIAGDTYACRYAGEEFLPEAGWVIFYNKDLMKAKGIDVPQLVRDYKWDFDTFIDSGIAVTADTDGDGVRDIHGIATGYLCYGEEVMITGGNTVEWENGKLVCKIDSVEAMAAYDFMDKVRLSGAIIQSVDGSANPSYSFGHTEFKAGHVGLLWSELRLASTRRGDGDTALQYADCNWGIAPVPMQPGDDHYSNLLGGVMYDVFFSTNRNIDTSLKIYTAIARRFNSENYADYLVNYVQGADESDTDTLDMLENYIFSDAIASWQWCTEEFSDTYREMVVYKIFDGALTPSQAVEAAKPVLQAMLDSLNN